MTIVLLGVMSILLLRGAVIADEMNKKACSDSVPLTQNVNGNISFSPGSSVLNGTNVTIYCNGIDGQKLDHTKHNPLLVKILKIIVFGPDLKPLHYCNNVGNIPGKHLPSFTSTCHHEITMTKDLGQFGYHCQFFTGIPTFFCVSSKNLTVTEDACQLKPCHPDAVCTRTGTSFQCKCKKGFTGDGRNCTDIHECSERSVCHVNASCFETPGSFQCRCHSGFVGDGKFCRYEGSKKLECDNSSCSIRKDPTNCKLLNTTRKCHCGQNYFGNGTHCIVFPRDTLSGSSKVTTLVIVFLIISSILIIFAIIWLFCRRRRNRRRKSFNRAVQEMQKGRSASKDNLGILFPDEKETVESSPRRKLPSIREHNNMEEDPDAEEENIMSYICVLDDWEIEKDHLTILDKKLGGGYFGVVKKGIYKEKENESLVVAVKMLKDSPSSADRSDLLMELYILKEVNKNPHPNVIKLIGACTTEEPILAITEFCARGNLRHLLRKSRIPVENEGTDDSLEYKNVFSTLCHRKLLQIAVDIANGMQHLAAHQFVHRDLSARNVLIGANYEAKVSDFGLARPITGADQMYVKLNRNLLPVKWMAVESLTQGIFRTSSDVWAFGIVLWEITTLGEEPYPEISPFETFTLVASGKRMERPAQCSEELYEIMKKSWDQIQENRPSFQDIHKQLKEMLAETDQKVYINIVEMNEESSGVLTDDRRISVESLAGLRYTPG